MNIERDKSRIQALDKGADMLSKKLREVKRKAEEFVELIHGLSSDYKNHINDSDLLLVHFQVCESRANSLRRNSMGESKHHELTKAHVVVTQVLKSYLIWMERSKHRRENHVHSLKSLKKVINHNILKAQMDICGDKKTQKEEGNNSNIQQGSKKEEDSDADEYNTKNNISENVNKTVADNRDSHGGKNDSNHNYSINTSDKYHDLEKELIEKSMEVKTWKNICESLRTEMRTLKTVVDSLSDEANFAQSSKVSRAEKEVQAWRKRCEDMQAETWDLRTKLKSIQLDSHGFKQSSARAQALESEVESLKAEIKKSKVSLAETCSRSKFNELVVAFEKAQTEKDSLALELVSVMSERDQLKQEKERTQWRQSQENEIAVMEIQGYLEAERIKVMGIMKQLSESKTNYEKHVQKYEILERSKNSDIEKLERLNRKIDLEKTTSVFEYNKIRGKLEKTLDHLKNRFAIRWVDTTKGQIFRCWCKYVANVRHMKLRKHVAENLFLKHEQYLSKTVFSKWKVFTDKRSSARRLVQNLFTNLKRRRFFQAYRQWHHQTIAINKELKHAEYNIRNAHRLLIKLQTNKYKKILHTWRQHAQNMVKRRRVIKVFFTSTYRRTLLKGWKGWTNKNANYPFEKAILNSHLLISQYSKKQRMSNGMKRILNTWHRHTNKNLRLEQLMRTHLIKWEGRHKLKSMSHWKYQVRDSKQKRRTMLRLMFKYRKSRFRHAFNNLKRGAFQKLLNTTRTIGENRIICSYKQKKSRNMQWKTFSNWSKFSKKKHRRKKALVLMINRMQQIQQKISFARWKIFTSYDIIIKGLEIHKLNLAENHNKSFHFRLRRVSFNKWKLFAKKSINCTNMLLNCLHRREANFIRRHFVTWNIQAKKRNKMRYCVRRMRNVIFKQGYFLAISKWKAEVQQIKIEDALCLGHSAMRKTKYDMAKRIFGRLRRSRLNQAFKQWKLDTRDERENDERTNAIEAMSNWAARVAGGRVMKERFEKWFAFTKQSILQKTIKETTLRNTLLRMWKFQLHRGFRKWTHTVDTMKRFEIKIAHEKRTQKLEGIIQDNEDVQQSKRHLALLNAVDLFHGRSIHNLRRKVFFAWKFSHANEQHQRKMTKQVENHRKQRRRSVEIAAYSLFSSKERSNLQSAFAKIKQFYMHMKSTKAFVRSLLLQYKCTKPIGQAFSKWQLTTSMAIAQSNNKTLKERSKAEVTLLKEKIQLLKQEEEMKQVKMKNKLENALLGWSIRRNKVTVTKLFHRWVSYLSILRYERMSNKLKLKIQEDNDMKIEADIMASDKIVSPPTPPPPPQPESSSILAAQNSTGNLGHAGGRSTLFQHTEMLEKENASLHNQLTAMQEEIERLSTSVAHEKGRLNNNNKSLMTLESLATDPSPFLEQDLEDLRKDNAVLQTELTNTQRKLFKAKQKIKQVSAGTKEKEKVLLLQENLTALDKKKNELENQVNLLQIDLQDAYNRIDNLEQNIKRYRNAASRSQQKSETDRSRVRQYEQRLKQEHENMLVEKHSSEQLQHEMKQMSTMYKRVVRDLENAKMNEESLQQSIRDERHTSHALAQKLQLSAQEIHHLLDENERMQSMYTSTNSKNSNDNSIFGNNSIMKEGNSGNKSVGSLGSPKTNESFVHRIDIDDLKSSPKMNHSRNERDADGVNNDIDNSTQKPNNSASLSPSSTFKKSLAAQVQSALKSDESIINESLSSLATNDESIHLYRDDNGRIFGRDSPEREHHVLQHNNDASDDVTYKGYSRADDYKDVVASNVSLAEGIVQMKSTETGNVSTTFKLNSEDKAGRFQRWR